MDAGGVKYVVAGGVGARSLRCFAIRSPGLRSDRPRNGDTIHMTYPARA